MGSHAKRSCADIEKYVSIAANKNTFAPSEGYSVMIRRVWALTGNFDFSKPPTKRDEKEN